MKTLLCMLLQGASTKIGLCLLFMKEGESGSDAVGLHAKGSLWHAREPFATIKRAAVVDTTAAVA